MALSRTQMDQKIDEHFGFEQRDDVEGVLATLAPDVEHDVVGWPTGPTRGRDDTRPVYEALFADLSDGAVECRKRLYGENFLVDEFLLARPRAGPSIRARRQGTPAGVPAPPCRRILRDRRHCARECVGGFGLHHPAIAAGLR